MISPYMTPEHPGFYSFLHPNIVPVEHVESACRRKTSPDISGSQNLFELRSVDALFSLFSLDKIPIRIRNSLNQPPSFSVVVNLIPNIEVKAPSKTEPDDEQSPVQFL